MSILHKIRAASERGKRMAKARWEQDRAFRSALAAEALKDPTRSTGKIIRRVVIIDNETTAREIVRRDYHTERDWRRIKRSAGI